MFWITAASDLAMAEMGVRLEVRYQFDGEPTPSVAFEPAMMAGNGWAAVPLGGRVRCDVRAGNGKPQQRARPQRARLQRRAHRPSTESV